MKLQEILGKTKQLCAKIGVRTLIAACAVLLIGSVVVLNFILAGQENDGKQKMAIDLSADPSRQTSLSDESGTSSGADYFAAISLQRKQARDEAMEVLLALSESETALEEAKQTAITDMNRMALTIEQEANIESLVESRGFSECVAVITEGSCNVIVETDGLMPGQIAQISEIVYEQAGIVPENLKIIEKTVQ